MKKFLIAATAAICTTPALAADPVTVVGESELPTARVAYGDLDLSNEAGLDTLKMRVRGAARQICLNNNVEPLSIRASRQRCAAKARADGYRQAEALHEQSRQGFAFADDAAIAIAAEQ